MIPVTVKKFLPLASSAKVPWIPDTIGEGDEAVFRRIDVQDHRAEGLPTNEIVSCGKRAVGGLERAWPPVKSRFSSDDNRTSCAWSSLRQPKTGLPCRARRQAAGVEHQIAVDLGIVAHVNGPMRWPT